MSIIMMGLWHILSGSLGVEPCVKFTDPVLEKLHIAAHSRKSLGSIADHCQHSHFQLPPISNTRSYLSITLLILDPENQGIQHNVSASNLSIWCWSLRSNRNRDSVGPRRWLSG